MNSRFLSNTPANASGSILYLYEHKISPLLLGRYVFSWVGRAGASEGRVISVSEHQKGKVIPLCKLFKGRVTHLFQNFSMRMDNLPKNAGRILPKGDWKSEYYRLFDLESTQVRHLSKSTSWLVFLLIICCLCGFGIWICQFLVMHWGALTIITKYSTTSHKLHAFNK